MAKKKLEVANCDFKQIDNINIESLIRVIRGQQVMLDSDLAMLYGDETAIRLRSQFATLNKGRGTHPKYLPYAFTLLGVSMLSSVLESDSAIEANRRIMRAFVTFHHLKTLPLANTYDELKQEIDKVREEMNDILADQNDINESTRAQLDAISTALAELQSSRSQIATLKPRKPIGFIQPEESDEEDKEEKK